MAERTALVVGYHAPGPDSNSGSRRLVHLMDFLQEDGWQVRFLAADGIGDERTAAQLRARGIEVADGYQLALSDVLGSRPVDLVLFAFWVTADRYLPELRRLSPGTRVVIDSVDLHLVREARRVLRPRTDAGGLGLGAAQATRFAAELNAYAAADLVLTVSEPEAGMVATLLADDIARAVPDHEEARPSSIPFEQRKGLLFLGSFQHPPNAEAVRYLCRVVLPRVDPALLDEHPVFIVGHALGDRVRALGQGLRQVRMVGWVPFVEPYLEQARASVIPLLHGAGTKRKLLQSLMTGTPAVSTTVGIEGFDLRHEESVLVADDPEAFAGSIERILVDGDLWSRLSVAGRVSVLRTNGRDRARAAFLEALELVMGREPKRVVPVGVEAGRDHAYPMAPTPSPDAMWSVVSRICPSGSRVLVMDGDDPRWRGTSGATATPFPHVGNGSASEWSGPGLVRDLVRQVAAGHSHLVIPEPSFGLLDAYPELRDHLQDNALLVHRDDSCAIIDLKLATARSDRDRPGVVAPGDAPLTAIHSVDAGPPVRLIAFYLPQFHPIAENDEWWGTGFTEWRNVARADPRFAGHDQPHIPADLGFYDLRLPETRWQQAQLARSHGIHGFCYYHYWFEGRRLLGRPFDEVLASGEPDLPFALCWANDPWSRRWDGREDDLLIAQTYSDADDLAHIRWLLPALADPRAITVDGKPMFLVYRATHLPDAARTTDTWREEVARAGLPGIHLVAVETAWDLGWDATSVGFDARVLFQPQFGWLMTAPQAQAARLEVPGLPDLQVYDYATVARAIQDIAPAPYRRYESVFPGWDNTARRGDKAVVMHDADPAAYESWLAAAVDRALRQPSGQGLVFLNAWNEWAEGCHLEPDRRHGRAFLEATRLALSHVDDRSAVPAMAGAG